MRAHALFRSSSIAASFLIVLLPYGSLAVGATPKSAPPASGTKSVATRTQPLPPKALQLFRAQRFGAAREVLEAHLVKHPQAENALALYARVLFKLDLPQESLAVFERIPSSALDEEGRYEQGQVFLGAERFDPAIAAFRSVPDGHALSDLANYFAGVAAIRANKYPLAQDLMDKAIVLPAKLAAQRKVYQAHIRKMLLIEERERLAAKELERQTQPALVANGAGSAQGTSTPAASQPVEHTWFLTGRHLPKSLASLRLLGAGQARSFSGRGQANSDLQQGRIEVHAAPMSASLDQDPGIGGWVVGMALDLGIEERFTRGSEQRFFITETMPDVLRLRTQSQGNTRTTAADIALRPWIEFQSHPGTWWGARAGALFRYPEFERSRVGGTREAELHLGHQRTPWTLASGVTYGEVTTSSHTAAMSSVRGQGQITYTSAGPWDIELQVAQTAFRYLDESLDGPDSLTQATTVLRHRPPLPVRFEAQAGVEYQHNALFHGVETFGEVSADGLGLSGIARLRLTPWRWLRIDAGYQVSKIAWSIHLAETEEVFRDRVADEVQGYNVEARVSTDF